MQGLESESAFIPRVVALPESKRSPLPLGGVSGVPTLIQSRCGNKGNFELLTRIIGATTTIHSCLGSVRFAPGKKPDALKQSG